MYLEHPEEGLKGLHHLLYRDKLKKLGFIVEKRRLQRDLIRVLKYLKVAYRKAGELLLIKECSA